MLKKTNGGEISDVIIISLLFLLPAIYNGFPLINSDSGAYLASANVNWALYDRPILYGYFIKCFAIDNYLWFVIIIQNFILAWIIRLFLKTFLNPYRRIYFYLTAIILALTTAMCWFSNQIMTDVFTPLLLLSISILLINKNLTVWQKIIISVIIFLSSGTHLSHPLLGISLITCLVILRHFSTRLKTVIPISRIYFTLLLIGLGLASIIFINLRDYHSFTLSRGASVLTVGKLMEEGLLQKYLDKHCATDNFKLCRFRNEFPQYTSDFIWSGNQSIVDKMGGIDSCDKEFKKIIKGTLKENFPSYVLSSIKNTLRNIVTLRVGPGIYSYDDSSSPSIRIKNYYSNQWQSYISSRQETKKLLFFNILTIVQYIIIAFSFISSILILGISNLRKSLSDIFIALFIILFLSLFLNAAITGALASVEDVRYESRIAWLLPLIIIIYCINYLIREKTVA